MSDNLVMWEIFVSEDQDLDLASSLGGGSIFAD